MPFSSAAASDRPSGAKATAATLSIACSVRVRPPDGHVPEPHRVVVGRRGERHSIRAEGDLSHAFGVAVQDPDAAAGADVPQPDRSVRSGAGQRLAVRAECDRSHEGHVPHQGRQVSARHGVPEPDRSRILQVRRGEDVTPGVDRQPGDRARPAVPAPDEPPGGHVPELDRFGFMGVVAARSQDRPVGRQCQRPGLVVVPRGMAWFQARSVVPADHRLVDTDDQ